METPGAVGKSATDFIQETGRGGIATTTIGTLPRSLAFLMQRRRLRVTVRRGNAVCITGTALYSSSLDNEFELL